MCILSCLLVLRLLLTTCGRHTVRHQLVARFEEALGHREIRNEAAPPVWTGASGETTARRDAARGSYTPEGF